MGEDVGEEREADTKLIAKPSIEAAAKVVCRGSGGRDHHGLDNAEYVTNILGEQSFFRTEVRVL